MDFDDELIESFIEESREGLESAGKFLTGTPSSPGPPEKETLEQVHRDIHSIKGCASFFPLPQLEKLAQAMENLLKDLAETPEHFSTPVREALADGVEAVGLMFDNLKESGSVQVDDLVERLELLLACAGNPETPESAETPDIPPFGDSTETESEFSEAPDLPKIRFDLGPATLKKIPAMHEFLYILPYDFMRKQKEGVDPGTIIRELLSIGIIVDSAFVSEISELKSDAQVGSFWFVVLYSTILGEDFLDEAVGLSADEIRTIDRDSLAEKDAVYYDIATGTVTFDETEPPAPSDAPPPPPVPETQALPNREDPKPRQQAALPPSAPEKETGSEPVPKPEPEPVRHSSGSVSEKPYPISASEPAGHQTVRVNIEKLDHLISLIGELVIAESMAAGRAADAGEGRGGADRSDMNMRRILTELQNVAMSVRMIALSDSFSRFARFIHDLSSETGKSIKVKLVGGETEVDKSVIEKLNDPVTRLIRFCVTRSIESPEERRKNGKTETGMITLEARHSGGDILIYVSDTGRGFDETAILRQAFANQITDDSDETRIDRQKAIRWVFDPAYYRWTPEELPPEAGNPELLRVRRRIEKLNGRIELQSRKGEGAVYCIRIPLTMSIIDGMLIRVGKSLFTIPLSAIRESFKASADQVTRTMGGQEFVRVREMMIPVIRLHRFYDVASDVTDLEEGILITVESGRDRASLFADEIIGHHQTVVKRIPEYIGKTRGFSGCSILNSGEVGLILDVAGIIEATENTSEYDDVPKKDGVSRPAEAASEAAGGN